MAIAPTSLVSVHLQLFRRQGMEPTKERTAVVGGKEVKVVLLTSSNGVTKTAIAIFTRGGNTWQVEPSTIKPSETVDDMLKLAVKMLKARVESTYTGTNVDWQKLGDFIDRVYLDEPEPEFPSQATQASEEPKGKKKKK